MRKSRPHVSVITGFGINCEKETANACALAGADPTFVHASELFSDSFPWGCTHLIIFPGGFSFGDELGAAKAFANRLTYHPMQLRDRLKAFADSGRCIMGICNGFQLLVKLGLLPGDNLNQTLSLINNASGRFECRWVRHSVKPSPCVFTKGIDSLYLPVRHGEGRLVGTDGRISDLFQQKQVVLQYADAKGVATGAYPENPNGSNEAVGGICDPTGRIFGMMAHPEAAVYFTNDPHWTRKREELKRQGKPISVEGEGLAIFKSVVSYLETIV